MSKRCVCACVSEYVLLSAKQVGSNFPACFFFFFFQEEVGDWNISGDESPVFCDSGAERALFTHFPPLGLAYKTRNVEKIKKKGG